VVFARSGQKYPYAVLLHGGQTTPVSLLDGTVRRVAGSWTPAVHALLRHLERRGFDGAPHALGFDDAGREVLKYVPGEAPRPPLPPAATSDAALVGVAKLLRRYHDAAAGFVPPPDARWRRWVGAPAAGPIVCHCDVTPSNVVFRGGDPVAFIDWDMAAPAPAIWDVASALKFWVPLMHPARAHADGYPEEPRARRLRLFCDAYGLARGGRRAALAAVVEKQRVAVATHRVWADAGVPGFAALWRGGSGPRIERDIAWLERERDVLERALR
jgi:hypothetical protein